MINSRHFFVVDSDGDRVGKFDIQSEKGRYHFEGERLPSDLSIEEIKIPEDVEDRQEALRKLDAADVKWDGRLFETE